METGPATRIAVDVTFLEMTERPTGERPCLPPGWSVRKIASPGVALYRDLYGTVGHDYCWWLRQTLADADLAALLALPEIGLYVLYDDDRIAGFFELDERIRGSVNLAYFGLMPSAIGRGVGRAFLAAAVDAAWSSAPVVVRVNTCTADHPRALGTYCAAGFRIVRVVRELWDIPDRLGLPIPDRLRA
ncbi:acetyltransferase [Ameyamaea chiangmaiensis NBRC 103196]|uniref:GNAT family N-acetyltransferase n=1 Tax=Ameyamaea chiangmaiensis TaxID=442969 RepID=A0A850PC51_9PROT|nr:GNAT family N-acetyltransferase [Ameyamaea chiangmaiensis]MBS4075387.1 GNAT family N-acetyltransferase [Ameyamaea chiangmaiensis]NVN39876.1 GNAT family N-acetyltransferase [Ameyamaea chiangmaiensis]GBQ69929.1 acetyltransferase [Ameyamaea chiangmaiensis NBRC 103196]